ncbi:MAG: hypothetical protein GX660_15375, partial [Clostridiaceae bacterium]|nr:hypothetical protein [Clostridiaceae bacterium]
MKSVLSFFKVSTAAPCNTAMCRNKIAWGIGRNQKQIYANNYYCDECMRQIVEAIP